MSHIEEGRRGEEWGRDWLKRRGCKLFGPDWIVKENGGPPFIAEVKYQETYEAPLFDGHGLPVHQVEARMEFYEETGVPTLLLVNDKAKGRAFYRWLHVLEAGDHYDTPVNRRRIYPLDNFKEAEL